MMTLYEEIYHLLGKGGKRVLRHKYTPKEKKIWRFTSNPRVELEEVKTELNPGRAEIRIVSIIYFIIVSEYISRISTNKCSPGISDALDTILKYEWF